MVVLDFTAGRNQREDLGVFVAYHFRSGFGVVSTRGPVFLRIRTVRFGLYGRSIYEAVHPRQGRKTSIQQSQQNVTPARSPPTDVNPLKTFVCNNLGSRQTLFEATYHEQR